MNFIQVNDHLIDACPELIPTFSSLGSVELPNNQAISVAEAITRIIIGQMLSKHAAQSIYNRVEEKKQKRGLKGSWQLSIDELIAQGVSSRKVKAIKRFGKQYDKSPHLFEAWRHLQHKEVREEVSAYWGLSTWSADILSIFYFGFEDVYPENDGSIKRVTRLLEQKGITFNPEQAAPYRSYLALYLWAILDQKLID